MRTRIFEQVFACFAGLLTGVSLYAVAAPRTGRVGNTVSSSSGTTRGPSNYYASSFSTSLLGAGVPTISTPSASSFPSPAGSTAYSSSGGGSPRFSAFQSRNSGGFSNQSSVYGSRTALSPTTTISGSGTYSPPGGYASSGYGVASGRGSGGYSATPAYAGATTGPGYAPSTNLSSSGAMDSGFPSSVSNSASRVQVNYPSVPPLNIGPVSTGGDIGGGEHTRPRGAPIPPSSSPLPSSSVTDEIAAAGADPQHGVPGSVASSLRTSSPGDDWIAGLFNRTSTRAAVATADFDPVKDANVNCDNAPPFPKDDFAAQSDNTKAYVTPAELPRNSAFALMGFTKFIRVFELLLIGTKEVGDIQMIHSAKVAAELLDNDGDGFPDDPEVMKSLHNYVVIMGYVGSSDESDVLWGERYMNPRNSAFREQYVCNIHFFEQWAADVSARYHTLGRPQGSAGSESSSPSRCGSASSIQFDWPLWYYPFTIAYYGYFDQLPAEKKESIKSKMNKATSAGLYVGQYPEDTEMEMAGFLVWSFLANLGALECHCNAAGIADVWKICTSKDLYEFDSEWVKFLDGFTFLPSKLPSGQYGGTATVPPPEPASSPAATNATSAAPLQNTDLSLDGATETEPVDTSRRVPAETSATTSNGDPGSGSFAPANEPNNTDGAVPSSVGEETLDIVPATEAARSAAGERSLPEVGNTLDTTNATTDEVLPDQRAPRTPSRTPGGVLPTE